jgi:hypothetical protein
LGLVLVRPLAARQCRSAQRSMCERERETKRKRERQRQRERERERKRERKWERGTI